MRVRVRGDGGRGARAHPNKLRSPIATHVCFFSSRAVRASTYSECLQLRCVCGPLTTSCALCAPAKSSDSPCPRVLDIRVSTRQYVCGSGAPGHPSPDARDGRVGVLHSVRAYTYCTKYCISGGAQSSQRVAGTPITRVPRSRRFFALLQYPEARGVRHRGDILHPAHCIRYSVFACVAATPDACACACGRAIRARDSELGVRDPCRYYLLQRAATTYLFEAEHGLRYGVESCAACPEHCVLCSRPCAARGSKRNMCRLWGSPRVGAEQKSRSCPGRAVTLTIRTRT